jgi:hypothetical protein
VRECVWAHGRDSGSQTSAARLSLWVCGRLGLGMSVGARAYVVKVAADHVHVVGNGLEIVVRVAVAQVARAQDMLDLAGHQQLFELGRQVAAAVRDVKVPNHKHELRGSALTACVCVCVCVRVRVCVCERECVCVCE